MDLKWRSAVPWSVNRFVRTKFGPRCLPSEEQLNKWHRSRGKWIPSLLYTRHLVCVCFRTDLTLLLAIETTAVCALCTVVVESLSAVKGLMNCSQTEWRRAGDCFSQASAHTHRPSASHSPVLRTVSRRKLCHERCATEETIRRAVATALRQAMATHLQTSTVWLVKRMPKMGFTGNECYSQVQAPTKANARSLENGLDSLTDECSIFNLERTGCTERMALPSFKPHYEFLSKNYLFAW